MAIGTNNASVMTGINNGVYAKLKAEVPSLTLIRCICHFIQLDEFRSFDGLLKLCDVGSMVRDIIFML